MVQGLGNNFIGANSVKDFNKLFDEHLRSIDKNMEQAGFGNFDQILEAKTQEMNIHHATRPAVGGMQINAGNMNIPDFYQEAINPYAMEVDAVKSTSHLENTMNQLTKGFSDSLNSINSRHLEAEHAVETLASGGDISVHEVMIAAEKANLSMQMGLQVRNKILAAYNSLYNISM